MDLGFSQSRGDYSIFTKIKGSSFIDLFVYVDDILIVSNVLQFVYTLKIFLDHKFKLKILVYGNTSLVWKWLIRAKSVVYPIEQKIKHSKDDDGLLSDPTFCRMLIGRLLYLNVQGLTCLIKFTG